ncbi:(2Fe-2S)-binding protein [Aliiroseovarius sp.]|uniref:(2Fe-2S)-binding protein n=1 Tax=Aliiroseovarius sp. TaxID=1872442 RepID=UPI003BAB9B98
MYRSLRPDPHLIELEINGKPAMAAEGTTVWSAMALVGQDVTRKAALSEADRSAFCAMGVCFECLVEIDGEPNQQACLRRVSPDMKVRSQVITDRSVVDHE